MNESAIYPTGNGCEAMFISKHPEAICYALKHFSNSKYEVDEIGRYKFYFSTQSLVKKAINHMTKKFKFFTIENWS